MKEILDFLAASPAFFIATTDENNSPKVRPFSFAMEWREKLTFVTNTTKPVYKQLLANPYVEICSFSPEQGKWMRISGSVNIFRDSGAIRKVFEIMPMLRDIYPGGENDGTIICFSIDKGVAATYSFESMNEPVKVVSI